MMLNHKTPRPLLIIYLLRLLGTVGCGDARQLYVDHAERALGLQLYVYLPKDAPFAVDGA